MIIETKETENNMQLDNIYFTWVGDNSRSDYDTRIGVYALQEEDGAPVCLGMAYIQLPDIRPFVQPEVRPGDFAYGALRVFRLRGDATHAAAEAVVKKWNDSNLPKDLKNIYEI